MPERLALHSTIAGELVPEGLDPEEPIVFFTTGCPGSGKSTVLRQVVHAFRTVLGRTAPAGTIDADYVRRRLPEYERGLGSFVVDPECYEIAYGEVFRRACDSGLDIVYDTLGHMRSIRSNLEELVSRGYRLHFLVAQVPIQVAGERVVQRALNEDGRIVEPHVLEASYGSAEEALEMLLAHGPAPDGWAVIDTSGPRDRPVLVKADATWAENFEEVARVIRTLP